MAYLASYSQRGHELSKYKYLPGHPFALVHMPAAEVVRGHAFSAAIRHQATGPSSGSRQQASGIETDGEPADVLQQYTQKSNRNTELM